jgi:hypothetical protein
VAIASKLGLAGALPWTSPSWLPRTAYQGTRVPTASKGFCAAFKVSIGGDPSKCSFVYP